MRLHGSVRKKLLGMISTLILLSVLLVTVLNYRSYRGELIAQSTQRTQMLLDQLAFNVDTYLDELFRLCLSPYYSKRVMEQLELVAQTPAQRLTKQRVIEDYLSEVMMLPRSDILRAHILTDAVYSSTKTRYDAKLPDDFVKADWYAQAMATNEAVFIPVHTDHQGKAEISIFSVVKRLSSMSDSGKQLGVIRVDANYRGIKTMCDRAVVGEGNALIIMDRAGNRVYENERFEQGEHSQELSGLLAAHEGQSTFFETLGGSQYLFNLKELGATDWRIIDVRSMQSLTAAAVSARNRSYWLAALCAALGVLCSVVLVRLFLRPIYEITGLMEKVREGDLSVRASVSGSDELAYLGHSFNEMTQRVDTAMQRNTLLTRQVYEARYLEKEAQYAALCSQIRPHFLFNALNTIALLSKTGRSREAAQCIDMLATLLRGMVNTDREITLQAELRIVNSYLSLQQKRYDTLTYELPDASAWASYTLPALTLQPLVENALVHGCEPKRGAANIAVTIERTPKALLLSVRDNGVGMTADALAQLTHKLEEATVEPPDDAVAQNGVGLVNISRRVRLKYGAAYGVSLQSAVGEGTVTTLHLPLDTADGVGGNVAEEGELRCTAP